MPESDYDYRAVSCRAERTFRLLRHLPVVVEFLAVSYTVEIYLKPHCGLSGYLIARLPWQDQSYARELDHGSALNHLFTAYDVECGSLNEVIWLRMTRQGYAEELAGPHVKVPPEFYDAYYREQRARRLASKPHHLRL